MGTDITGKAVCLVIVTASLLILLWLYAGNRGKNKKDAVKVLVLAGMLGLIICMTEQNEQALGKDGRLEKREAGKSAQSHELLLDAEGILEVF